MFCPKCGAQLSDDSRFCPKCGNPLGGKLASQPQPPLPPYRGNPNPGVNPSAGPQPSYYTGQQPASGKAPRPKKKPLVPILLSVGIVVMVVIIAAAVVLLLGSSSPNAAVGTAIGKTVNAYTQNQEALEKALGLSGVVEAIQKDAMEQTLTLTLPEDGIPGQQLPGEVSIFYTIQSDMPHKQVGMELGMSLADIHLASVQLYCDENVLSAASPEFTDGNFYGIHPATLGKDINRAEWAADLGLNIPDDLGITPFAWDPEELALDKATTEALKTTLEEFLRAHPLEKTDGTEIDGRSLNGYVLSLSEDDLAELICGLADGLCHDQLFDTLVDSLTGLADAADSDDLYEIIEILDAVEHMRPDDIAGSLPERTRLTFYADRSGLWRLEVRLDDGKIQADFGSDGVLGNGFNLRIETLDGETLQLRSEGDHTMANGVYSDTTSLKVDGETLLRVRTEYDSGKKTDNYSCKVSVSDGYDTVDLSVSGSVSGSGKTFTAELDKVNLTVEEETLSMGIVYTAAPLKGMDIDGSNADILTDMSLDELETLVYDVEDYADDWIAELRDDLIGLF